MHSFKLADPETWKSLPKTLGGDEVILVAIQKSRRILRKGKTKYIYHRRNTKQIYWNRSENSILFLPMARLETNMKRYYDAFVDLPLTPKQEKWLSRNDYELLSG